MKTKDKATTMDYIIGIIGMAILALMIDMAIVGITPAEFIETIRCYL